MFEGKEDFSVLQAHFAKLNVFLKLGKTSKGTFVSVWEGGDLKYLVLKCGLSGNFAHHDMCLWCHASRKNLGSLESSPPRTISTIRVRAHLPPLNPDGSEQWPFTCPCCKIKFTQANHALEKLSEDMLRVFPSTHQGCVWHQAPCTTTEIDFMVPCVLHMRLRFCSTLWEWCIAPSAYVKKAEVAERIMKMLQCDGVNTTRLRKLNNFNDLQVIKNASFDGQGCDKVLARFDEYLVASRSSHRALG